MTDEATARPAELRIGPGAAKLLSAASEPQSRGRPDGHDDHFGEGQIAGPNGPKFARLGEPVFAPLWRDLTVNAAWGAGVGAGGFAVMIAARAIGAW